MQDKVSFEELYTELSASIVVYENEIFRQGKVSEGTSNRRCILPVAPVFDGFGDHYAHKN